MNNIPTFTAEQQQDNLKKAIHALRNNDKKAIQRMEDEHGGRCCLKVMSDVAEDICGMKRGSLVYYKEDGPAEYPKAELASIYGLPPSKHVDKVFDFNISNTSASLLNDMNNGSVYSHAAIADMIEKEYVK